MISPASFAFTKFSITRSGRVTEDALRKIVDSGAAAPLVQVSIQYYLVWHQTDRKLDLRRAKCGCRRRCSEEKTLMIQPFILMKKPCCSVTFCLSVLLRWL